MEAGTIRWISAKSGRPTKAGPYLVMVPVGYGLTIDRTTFNGRRWVGGSKTWRGEVLAYAAAPSQAYESPVEQPALSH